MTENNGYGACIIRLLSVLFNISEIFYSVEGSVICIVIISCEIKCGAALENNIVSLYFKGDVVEAVFVAVKVAVVEYIVYQLPIFKVL